MDNEEDGLFSRCSLGFLPNRLAVLGAMTPEKWVELFRFIRKNVSILLENNNISVFSDLSHAAVLLSSPKRLKSLSNFCLDPQFDDNSRQTLSDLLVLLSRLAIKLDEPDSLSSSLMSLSRDLTKMKNYPDANSHPIYILARKIVIRYAQLPEDLLSD
ncbi:hypothetical protein M9Y10_033963 [Tritrichomonas musculus]|uniref:Uncharacterized protein n=1 Tax=Tritrichomonas musculus TaxID=1915356 RepID=A0ABR2KFI1_9EUKA